MKSVLCLLFHTSAIKTSSEEMAKTLPKYTYEQFKNALKRPEAVVIDVREREELKETGEIPGTINIPVGTIETAFLKTTDEKFKTAYGREKPGKETEIVLSCKAGGRSELVQNVLLGMGFKKVYNYAGGWLDYEKHLKSKN